MKKKTGFFREKICVTVSSRECTHRAPISFSIHRMLAVTIALLLVAVVAYCTYTTVDALLKEKALAATANTLNTRIDEQDGQISQYEQQISELEQEQQ